MKKFRTFSAVLAAFTAAAVLPFTAACYDKGDVNRDGFIDARDASAVLREYAILSTGGAASLALADGDYNGDGQINAADASAILVKYAELSTGANKTLSLTEGYVYGDAISATDSEPTEEVVTGQAELGVRLLRALGKDENVMVSPFSITTALCMTANGAKGDTLNEMKQLPGMEAFDRSEEFAAFTYRLNEREEFGSANSIWFRNDPLFYPNEGFLRYNAEYYGADIFKAPFDGSTVNDINSWVSENTHGMIPTLLNDIDSETMMYLINAAVFEGEWAAQYEDYQVRNGSFTAADGTVQDVDMMHSSEYTYLEGPDAVGFYKYYKGGKFAFAAILPNEGISLDDYIAGLDGGELFGMMNTKQRADVIVTMPKFSYSYKSLLNDVLMDMGMNDAFTPNADFSGMSDYPLNVGRVIHKTYIEVNEFGTKAGAVTAVGMDGKGMPPDEYKYVTLDRPFLYCIVDVKSNMPLFMGTVKNISENS